MMTITHDQDEKGDYKYHPMKRIKTEEEEKEIKKNMCRFLSSQIRLLESTPIVKFNWTDARVSEYVGFYNSVKVKFNYDEQKIMDEFKKKYK